MSAPLDSRQLRAFRVLARTGSFTQAARELQNQATALDHQQMLDQLGITRLRPGPSGDPKSPDSANYDEAKANPYPDWPDPLRLNNGKRVDTAKAWRQQRRPSRGRRAHCVGQARWASSRARNEVDRRWARWSAG